jgi:Ca-activated chloride channel family protein
VTVGRIRLAPERQLRSPRITSAALTSALSPATFARNVPELRALQRRKPSFHDLPLCERHALPFSRISVANRPKLASSSARFKPRFAATLRPGAATLPVALGVTPRHTFVARQRYTAPMELTYRLAHPATPTQDGSVALLLVTVRAPALPLKRRPMHLGIAIDRSSSMRGTPLETAKVALRQFMGQLVADDKLTLVAFNDETSILAGGVPASDKSSLEIAIGSMQAEGMTNLSGGWLAAADLLTRSETPGHDSRIILLTDGQANRGVCDPAAIALIADGLRTRGIATTTIGIGADYDDSLLTVIAAHTGGNQHHADEADRIGPILAAELEDLVELYAQNVTLRFAPSAGVVTAQTLNGYPTVPHDGGFSVLCGDIVAGDERSVLIEFVCKPGAGPQQLSAVTLSYQQVACQVAFHESVAFVDIMRADTDEPVPMDPIVAHNLSIVKTVEARREASRAVEVGEHDQARNILFLAANQAEHMGLSQDAEELRHDAVSIEADAMMTSKRLKMRSESRSRHGKKRF